MSAPTSVLDLQSSSLATNAWRSRTLSIILLIVIAGVFWGDSRYPALMKRYHAGSQIKASGALTFGTVYAVDISKSMIDHIEKTAREIPNLKAVLGSPHSPKLEPNSVDLVSIIDSYHHFEFPQDMLREIRKALRPDGVLLLIDFKRIEGVSKDFILTMVRAGEGTFTDEFQNAGFELIERRDDMFEDNYLLRFRHRRTAEKPALPAKAGQ